jgi:predicted transcriptional regulator YdeE
MYTRETIEAFNIIGLAVETTNANGASAKDIGELWSRFYSDNVVRQIPNMEGAEVYSVYTDYESDHTGMYTCIIGVKVSSLQEIPEGLYARAFPSATMIRMIAKGPMPNAIFEQWQKIWEAEDVLGRSYEYDFEVYGERSMWGDEAEVDIYLSVQV